MKINVNEMDHLFPISHTKSSDGTIVSVTCVDDRTGEEKSFSIDEVDDSIKRFLMIKFLTGEYPE